MSPSPTLGSIIKKSKALQVLRVEDHQKTRYKPMSYKGSNPQASKRQALQVHILQKDQAYKPTSFEGTIPKNCKDKLTSFKRIKPTTLQASKVYPINFEGISPQVSKTQVHKLQRAKAHKL